MYPYMCSYLMYVPISLMHSPLEEWRSGACVGRSYPDVVRHRGGYAVDREWRIDFFSLDGVAKEDERKLEEGVSLGF